ncbi:response regulator [Flavipsychrobacter stenotrophus]|uniref:Response regulator n=1 Tax=Flavipsychrobacter stenotrophus TaxID=2077091 RepID=A0A2S7ST33_9BACT|nr:response regulator [Flavipsychrobacter stenotrophus]PQJ10080.1 response regulator [Flavipsychrobacter stenotrophus]
MIKILLIEDDLDDVELLEDTLQSNNVAYIVNVKNDGNAAIEYIKTCVDCPDIIILDFNLPKVHGREVIKEIKSLPSFRDIPLLILTTSSAKEDMDYAYKHGADKYLIKPTSLQQIKEMCGVIVDLAKK